jgi:hypothetical protein
VVGEGRIDVPLLPRQRDPQPHAVKQGRAPRGRFLGVGDAAAGGHEVQLAWAVFFIFGVEAWALGALAAYQVLFLQAG